MIVVKKKPDPDEQFEATCNCGAELSYARGDLEPWGYGGNWILSCPVCKQLVTHYENRRPLGLESGVAVES